MRVLPLALLAISLEVGIDAFLTPRGILQPKKGLFALSESEGEFFNTDAAFQSESETLRAQMEEAQNRRRALEQEILNGETNLLLGQQELENSMNARDAARKELFKATSALLGPAGGIAGLSLGAAKGRQSLEQRRKKIEEDEFKEYQKRLDDKLGKEDKNVVKSLGGAAVVLGTAAIAALGFGKGISVPVNRLSDGGNTGKVEKVASNTKTIDKVYPDLPYLEEKIKKAEEAVKERQAAVQQATAETKQLSERLVVEDKNAKQLQAQLLAAEQAARGAEERAQEAQLRALKEAEGRKEAEARALRESEQRVFAENAAKEAQARAEEAQAREAKAQLELQKLMATEAKVVQEANEKVVATQTAKVAEAKAIKEVEKRIAMEKAAIEADAQATKEVAEKVAALEVAKAVEKTAAADRATAEEASRKADEAALIKAAELDAAESTMSSAAAKEAKLNVLMEAEDKEAAEKAARIMEARAIEDAQLKASEAKLAKEAKEVAASTRSDAERAAREAEETALTRSKEVVLAKKIAAEKAAEKIEATTIRQAYEEAMSVLTEAEESAMEIENQAANKRVSAELAAKTAEEEAIREATQMAAAIRTAKQATFGEEAAKDAEQRAFTEAVAKAASERARKEASAKEAELTVMNLAQEKRRAAYASIEQRIYRIEEQAAADRATAVQKAGEEYKRQFLAVTTKDAPAVSQIVSGGKLPSADGGLFSILPKLSPGGNGVPVGVIGIGAAVAVGAVGAAASAIGKAIDIGKAPSSKGSTTSVSGNGPFSVTPLGTVASPTPKVAEKTPKTFKGIKGAPKIPSSSKIPAKETSSQTQFKPFKKSKTEEEPSISPFNKSKVEKKPGTNGEKNLADAYRASIPTSDSSGKSSFAPFAVKTGSKLSASYSPPFKASASKSPFPKKAPSFDKPKSDADNSIDKKSFSPFASKSSSKLPSDFSSPFKASTSTSPFNKQTSSTFDKPKSGASSFSPFGDRPKKDLMSSAPKPSFSKTKTTFGKSPSPKGSPFPKPKKSTPAPKSPFGSRPNGTTGTEPVNGRAPGSPKGSFSPKKFESTASSNTKGTEANGMNNKSSASSFSAGPGQPTSSKSAELKKSSFSPFGKSKTASTKSQQDTSPFGQWMPGSSTPVASSSEPMKSSPKNGRQVSSDVDKPKETENSSSVGDRKLAESYLASVKGASPSSDKASFAPFAVNTGSPLASNGSTDSPSNQDRAQSYIASTIDPESLKGRKSFLPVDKSKVKKRNPTSGKRSFVPYEASTSYSPFKKADEAKGSNGLEAKTNGSDENKFFFSDKEKSGFDSSISKGTSNADRAQSYLDSSSAKESKTNDNFSPLNALKNAFGKKDDNSPTLPTPKSSKGSYSPFGASKKSSSSTKQETSPFGQWMPGSATTVESSYSNSRQEASTPATNENKSAKKDSFSPFKGKPKEAVTLPKGGYSPFASSKTNGNAQNTPSNGQQAPTNGTTSYSPFGSKAVDKQVDTSSPQNFSPPKSVGTGANQASASNKNGDTSRVQPTTEFAPFSDFVGNLNSDPSGNVEQSQVAQKPIVNPPPTPWYEDPQTVSQDPRYFEPGNSWYDDTSSRGRSSYSPPTDRRRFAQGENLNDQRFDAIPTSNWFDNRNGQGRTLDQTDYTNRQVYTNNRQVQPKQEKVFVQSRWYDSRNDEKGSIDQDYQWSPTSDLPNNNWFDTV